MPPPIPDRYRLEVRLGRDRDVEEWLAVDTSLDRPVLIRILGPDSAPERRKEFLGSVRSAAAISHTHLSAVYGAEEVPHGAYSVSEWTGGATLADRIRSGTTLEPTEFLANAAGLASALAALHDMGVVHGSIDASAISYSVAHAAKLGAFGRPPVAHTASDDVRDLSRALEQALTGGPSGGPPPSELIDGLSPAVDSALADARSGLIGAHRFADDLASAPSPRPPAPVSAAWSRRLLLTAVGLVALAAGLVGLGRIFAAGAGAPILLPSHDSPTSLALPPTTTTTTQIVVDPSSPPDLEPVATREITTFDPFGEGGENDGRLPNLTDGDPGTVWRTERYRDPIERLKPGVGLVLAPAASPAEVEFVGITPGVGYSLRWSADRPDSPDAWEPVATGHTVGAVLTVQLPPRPGGFWLLWIDRLPRLDEDDHSAQIGEVRFRA